MKIEIEVDASCEKCGSDLIVHGVMLGTPRARLKMNVTPCKVCHAELDCPHCGPACDVATKGRTP